MAWSYEKRKNLEKLIKDGYNLKSTARLLGYSTNTIRNELVKGLDEEEIILGRYLMYDIEKAIKYDIERYLDEESIKIYNQMILDNQEK